MALVQQTEQAQDDLRPLRAFVGAVNGWLGSDQSYAGQDGQAYNPPRQFMVLGGQGVSIEGTQTAAPASARGGLVLPSWALPAAIVGGLVWLASRKG